MLTDREMILDPNSWPGWPRLPLKKIREGDSPQCGMILGDPKGSQVFFMENINIWDNVIDSKKGLWTEVDDLLDAGWVID